MPDVTEHLRQARHNEAFFASIDLALYSDWAVTVLFYAALHYIDAYLAKVGYLDPGSHGVRDSLIRKCVPTRQVVHQYFRLKNFSRTARYYGGQFSPTDVTGLHRSELQKVKTTMTAQVP